MRGVRAMLAAALSLGLTPSAAGGSKGKELPERYREPPLSMASLSIGYPNAGRHVRAKKLTGTRELEVRKSSRGRAYGHPALVLMLRRSAADVAKAVPGSVLLVGDLSTKAGGPLSGHHSHQSGRDADVAFYVTDSRGRRIASPRFVAFDGDGKAKDGSGLLFDDLRNWHLVESWVEDRRAGLSHIFVSAPLRARLLAFAARHPRFRARVAAARALLKQPEKGEPHDDHFHVRISCPKAQHDICRDESRLDSRVHEDLQSARTGGMPESDVRTR